MTRAEPQANSSPGLRSANEDWLRALERTAGIDPAGTRTLSVVIDENAVRYGAEPALIGESGSLSHAGLAALSNQYSRWAIAQSLRPGDVVALMLGNCEHYVAIWSGLTRLGVVVALANTQLTGSGLRHCLALTKAGHVIVGAEHAATVQPMLSRLEPQAALWVHGADGSRLPRIDEAVARLRNDPLDAEERREVRLRDRALLIFTSGTTGLPKAAYVSHYRIMMWSEWFAGVMHARPDDRLFNCLPMYHSVGGIVAVGAMLAVGGSIVVRRSFSASRFWSDVVETEATIFQYIGDLCRYLLNTPPQDAERCHRLRLCCGNGLGAQIWERFSDRFAIPRIIEFYAATEGSFSLFNLEGKPGSIGRVPRFMAHRSPVALVKFDVDAERPIRDADGRCIPCGRDEPGEAIGRLERATQGLASRFEGYTSPEETERKILRNVFAEGDAWFRTGDLMKQDRDGFYFFVDRIGDTFRWKGENVATSEVAEVLCGCPGVRAAAVYGVRVPSADGRAGMAALVAAPDLDVNLLQHHLERRLPSCARPIFLRVLDAIDITPTFKFKKTDLSRQGFDPMSGGDVFAFDTAAHSYRRLDARLYASILSGTVRF